MTKKEIEIMNARNSAFLSSKRFCCRPYVLRPEYMAFKNRLGGKNRGTFRAQEAFV